MLQHGGERHVERLRQLAHRRRPSAETLDHVPPRRIGEGLEDEVELWMVKHVLNY